MPSLIMKQEFDTIGKKILLVDDQDFNIKALQIILKYKVGIDVQQRTTIAFDGQEALNIIRNDVESNRN